MPSNDFCVSQRSSSFKRSERGPWVGPRRPKRECLAKEGCWHETPGSTVVVATWTVAEATVNRKEDHEDYVNDLAANIAAVELMDVANNPMQTFYNPKQYKAPPNRELTEEERITVNNGGTLAPTGIAGSGVEALQIRGAPPPPPEAPTACEKKGEALR